MDGWVSFTLMKDTPYKVCEGRRGDGRRAIVNKCFATLPSAGGNTRLSMVVSEKKKTTIVFYAVIEIFFATFQFGFYILQFFFVIYSIFLFGHKKYFIYWVYLLFKDYLMFPIYIFFRPWKFSVWAGQHFKFTAYLVKAARKFLWQIWWIGCSRNIIFLLVMNTNFQGLCSLLNISMFENVSVRRSHIQVKIGNQKPNS